ncbi:Bug family tripartite tricarboxylate transporter substrate binding protein [Aeromicrobium sp. CF4.19]|uniref:Bug family tripartite tricarboxylate transporter substrate binding protein n=1 Tax=Aeromicrobium sp. CF4.19 TaxID=3373082 RepID=UPI003EE60EA0
MKITNSRALRRRAAHRAVAVAAALSACAALTACSALGGQTPTADYPAETIEFIVPYAPGGSADPVAREFSRQLAEEMGTSVNVFNKPGGDESIGISEVVAAESDGYTLGLASSPGLLAQPLVNDSLQYGGYEDVTPVVQMTDTPFVLLVPADSPYESVDDLVQDAKENPGEVRVGVANTIGNNGFAFNFLQEQAEVDMTMIPSAGGAGESALAAMGGEIEALIAAGSGQLGLVESGDLRALAYTGSSYGDVLPDAVSFEEAGYDIPFSTDYVVFGPAGVSGDVRDKIVAAAEKVASGDEWVSWTEKQGDVPTAVVGDELTRYLTEQRERIKQAIETSDTSEG